MLIGAALMVIFQITSIESAFKSINLDVIGFLFGMFSIVSAMDKSGVYKESISKDVIKDKRSPRFDIDGVCCWYGITFCILGK